MTPRRGDALTAALLAASAAAVLAGLGRLPALSGDEAWIGMFAARLASRGLYTPHEMNAYTGPLYGLLLSRLPSAAGGGVAALRALGAGANVAAFAWLALDLRRRVGPAAAAWFAAALAASAYLLLKSRLAWDVYALQPLLLAATISLLDAPVVWWRALAFCAATLIGVQNHFIYLAVPLSLCVLYSQRGDRAWLRLSLAALAMGGVVFVVKPRLAEAAWMAERAWAVPSFLALPALAAAAALRGGWEDRVRALAEKARTRRLLALGLLAFAVWHLLPLWQALAGPVVWKRLFSWDAPWWLDVPLHAWSAFLLTLIAWRAVRAWHGDERLSAHERTLALWPAAYAAVFTLFRNTSSLRYYSAIQFLCLAALGPALARLPRPDRRIVAALAAAALGATHAVLWRELAAPAARRPLTFKIGWHTDSSWDFADKRALFAAFDASGACVVAHQERSFVALPLDFHRRTTGFLPCDAARAFDADQCRDCAAPPFYRWSVVSADP